MRASPLWSLVGCLVVLGSACAPHTKPVHSDPRERYVTTYYDRNGDGRVDYEFHDIPGWADDEWAMRDTDFDGFYDVRYDMGYPGGKSRVHISVPSGVRITTGRPPGGVDW
jgi:hypothetical protein